MRGIGPLINLLAAGKGISLFRFALVLRRSGRSIRQFLHVSRFGYLVAVTVVVVVLLAAFVLMFERDAPNSNIRRMSDALWWSSAVCTTVACDLNPVTPGGRILAVFLMVYGMAVFGYFISRAVLFIHSERTIQTPGEDGAAGAGAENTGIPDSRKCHD